MKKQQSKLQSFFAIIVIPLTIVFAYTMFFTVLGHSSNFEGGDSSNHPLPGNWLGIIYKGGIVVPMLMAFFLMVITFSLERFLTLNKAFGKGSLDKFLRDVKAKLAVNNTEGAIDRCLEQKGSVGNVVYNVVNKYQKLLKDNKLNKDQKVLSVQKELEESTSLELPMLEKNLTIIATLASVATLVGLLGTVVGMIKAFAALATAGAPDAVALANGISEALINTALGIASSALAIIAYNYFTSKIDTLTYSIDEIGFSIVQNFSTFATEDVSDFVKKEKKEKAELI
jgi:biopolymer transport protein ExbB